MTAEQQKELFYKATPISNILAMQKVIGVTYRTEEQLNKLSYDQLHELQNSLISEYNASIKKVKKEV